MNFKVINEIKNLDTKQLEEEIIATKTQLFELRFKKATRQSFQSHSFTHLKYKLRLLLMFQNIKNPSIKKRRKKLLHKRIKI
jgi:large subunit ribosomal protein L29